MENFYCFDENCNYIGSTVDDARVCFYLYVKDSIDTIEDFDKNCIMSEGIFENHELLYRFDKETDKWVEILAGNSYDTILKYIKNEEPEKEKTYTLYITFIDTKLIKIAQGSLMEISNTMNTLEKICNANKIIKFIIE